MKKKFFLSSPNIRGNEWKYIKDCLDTEWVSSAGKYVELFEQKIAEYVKTKYAIACVNGTSALQVSLKLAGVSPGDEVIAPTITFIAPINAIAYNGASPVFMDSDNFFNIDSNKTIDFIKNHTIFKNGFSYNKKTKKKISAIIPVHVWGNACDLHELISLCRERSISIIEDASESIGTFYNSGKLNGNHTGTVGDIGCLSFNGNKIITSGGGGMIITNNYELALKAKYLTTQAKDDPINFVHNNIGYNYRLTNIQAALGLAQLEQLPVFLKEKKTIFNHYQTNIDKINGLAIATTPDYSKNNHWMNVLKIDHNVYAKSKMELFEYLKNRGVETRPVWALNHTQMPYRKSQKYLIEKAFTLYDYSICLPSSSNLKRDEICTITDFLVCE